MGPLHVPVSLPALLATAFVVSLVTVAVPGPITLVASRLAISRRITYAVWFLVGVTVVDVSLFFALATGAASVLERIGALPPVEFLGGFALLVAGVLSLRSRTPSRPHHLPQEPSNRTVWGSFVLGVAVAVGNPHYWIWWVTAGLAFVSAARSFGPFGLAWMLAALIGGVVSWYVPLLWALHRGKAVLSSRAERIITNALGILLVVLGLGLITFSTIRLLR